MQFSDVIGQAAVKQHLLQMVDGGRLPHALLFCGPAGCGKMALALALAHRLLCQHPTSEGACGHCPTCKLVAAHTHPDLHFCVPVFKRKSTDKPVSDDFLPEWNAMIDRSPYFDMEDWIEAIEAGNQQTVHYVYESDALQGKLSMRPNQGGWRVVVMWMPERMNEEMANKLLKLIEEPPSQTCFILVCEEPDRVLPTIASRTQFIAIPPLQEEEVAAALQARYGFNSQHAANLAHVAQGDFVRALRMANGGDLGQEFFHQFKELTRMCYMSDIRKMRKWTAQMAELGREKQKLMLDLFQHVLRENFIYNFHLSELNYQTAEEAQFSIRFAPFIHEHNVMQIMELFSTAQRDIAQNVNARMVFFCLTLNLAVLLRTKRP